MVCVGRVANCTAYIQNSYSKLLMKFVGAFQLWLISHNGNRLEALHVFLCSPLTTLVKFIGAENVKGWGSGKCGGGGGECNCGGLKLKTKII
jgi:hypothetical protein